MRKMKRTKKKNMGLEARIKREAFLQELKNPTTRSDKEKADGQEILKKIRARNDRYKQKPSPYDCGSDSIAAKAWDSLRKKAGLI